MNPLSISVNGEPFELLVDARTTLLDLLRDELGLTGAKSGCDHGQCGACTVLLDGMRVTSCLALAIAQDGREVITIEGLAQGDDLHRVQQAFLDHDALQCGFCTPGQVCSTVGMLREAGAGWPSAVTADLTAAAIDLDAPEIRERLSGNLCRCGAYVNIVAAVEAVVE